MKALAERLRRLPPLVVTAIVLICVLMLALLDWRCPPMMSFTLFYLLLVVLVGWRAGFWPAVVISACAASAPGPLDWDAARDNPGLKWVVFWNIGIRFLGFSGVGWLTAEVARLTRHLSGLVEERTAQWKAEATEHKRTSERLAEAMERFEQVVNNIAEAFWLSDVSNEKIFYVSPGYERIWGRRCEEVYRDPGSWLAAVHPADRDMLARRVQTEMPTGAYDVEYRIVRPDGAIRWIRDQAFPVRNAAGEVCRVAGIARDITERHQAHEAWQMQAAILESMAEAVVVTDEQGVILQVNPAAERIWGYGPKELVGQPADVLSALTEPERSARMQEVLAALRDTGSWRGTFKNRRKDGSIVYCDAVMNRLELPDRVLYVALEEDVTERTRAEKIKDALLSLGTQLSAAQSPAEAARAVFGAADQFWHWDTAVLDFHSPATETMRHVLCCDVIDGRRCELPLDYRDEPVTPRMRRILREGPELILRQPPYQPSADARMVGDVARPSASIMSVPVRLEGRAIGVLSVQSYQPDAYTEEDLRTLQALADHGAGALERLRAEAAARASEQTYRALVETTGTGYLILNLEGRVEDANEEYVRLSGHKALREIQGRSVVEWTAPGDRDRNAAAVEECIKTGAVRNLEISYSGPDGRVTPVEINGTVVKTAAGQRVLSLCWDISTRKRAERLKDALLSLGSRLSAVTTPAEAARVIYAAADQLWQWDAGALVLRAADSDQCTIVLGWDILDGRRREIAPIPARPPTGRMRRIMAGAGELMLRKPGELPTDDFRPIGDTSRLAASLMYVPVRTEGQVIGVLSVHSYLHDAYTPEDLQILQALADYCGGALERLRAEEALQQREQLNRAILASAMDGYYILDFAADPLGRFVEANEAFCRMTGYSREALLTLRIADLEAVESPEEVARHVEQVMAQGGDRFETRLRRQDGREIALEICISLLPGRPGGVFGFVRDITERKQAELTREVFLSLGARLGAAQNPIEAARTVYAAADRLWRWDSATVSLCSAGSDAIEPVLFVDVVNGQRREVPAVLPGGVPTARMRRVMQQGPELILRRAGEPPDPETVRYGDVSRASASLMCVPFRREGRSVGFLSIQSYRQDAFTAEDLRTLVGLADYCGAALERIQAEAALREREELLRAFFDSPGAVRGVIELLEDDILVLSANLPQAQAYGRSVEQMRSVPASQIGVTRETIDLWREKFQQSAQANGPITFEYSTAFRAPGTWGSAMVCPLETPRGARPRFAYIATDITERIRAEAALRESEWRLRMALEATSMVTWEWDIPAGRIRYSANTPAVARGEAIEPYCSVDGLVQEVHPDDRAALAQAIHRTVNEGRPYECEYRVRMLDGAYRWISGQGAIVERTEGKPVRAVGISQDITDRKHAERVKEALLSLGATLSTAQAPVEAARAVYAAADRLWQWDSANLNLYLPESDLIEPVLYCDVVDGERREVPAPWAGGSPTPRIRFVMQHGAQLVLREPGEAPDPTSIRYGDASRASASIMSVPIHRESQMVGVLSIQSYTHHAYTPEDLRVLQALADYCGGALERIRAEAALREAHDRLEQRVRERTAELQEANAALRESESRLGLALEASGAGTWSWDAASGTSNWDDRYDRLYGFEPGARRSHEGWLSRVHPADRQRLLARIQTLLGSGSSDIWHEEFRAVHPVLGERWMEGLGRVQRDQTGRAVRFSGINLDITERKAMEQALREAYEQLEQRVMERTADLQAANAALRESEERYRSLVNNLSVGVFRTRPGPEGGFIQANPALARMHGYDSVEDFQKVRVRDLYQDPESRVAFLSRLQGEGTLLHYEVCLKRRDGTPLYASVNATAHRGPDGAVDWIDGVIEDITERKRAREALRASEERYRTLAESSPDAILIVDRDLRVSYVNSTAAALWQRKADDIVGRTQADLFSPETAQYHQRVLSNVFETGKPVRRDEPITFPVGHQWVELRLAPLYNAAGAIGSVMGIYRDITERKRAEQELAEALDLNQQILAASPIGIEAFKASGDCVFANKATGRIVGGALPEILRRSFRRLASWKKAGLLELAERALTARKPQAAEVHWVSSFGREAWADVRMAAFRRGGELHLLCMYHDVSQRKRMEAALREAERLRKAILDNIPDPVWLKDMKGRFLAGNEALARFYGRPLEAIVGSTVFDTIPREAKRMTREDKEVLRTKRPLRGEVAVTDSQGRNRWLESIKAPLFTERNELAGTVGIAREITERKQAETLLAAQRDLGLGLGLAGDLDGALKHFLGIAVRLSGVDCGGVYLFNESTRALELAAHAGLSAAFVKEVAHYPPDSPNVKLLRQGKAVFDTVERLPIMRTKIERREGLRGIAFIPLYDKRALLGSLNLASHIADEIPLQTRIVIEAIAAQAAGAIARLRAEADRQRLERQLLEISDRQQARIGQDIHDGLCQSLVSLAFDANSLHQALSAGHRPEARTSRRIALYLDHAITEARQLSHGLFPVRLTTVGLSPALEELARITAARFKLRCRFFSRRSVAVADGAMATHLYRIAQEAVANAIKHSRARSVSIALRADARKLVLSIEDDGHGLAPGRRTQAAGLGLHIMDYRARTIGGTLHLARGRRGGTLVSCCVPRQNR